MHRGPVASAFPACNGGHANYFTQEVKSDAARVRNFFETFCRTDMQLEEHILSRDEYALALKGKRHFKEGA